MRETEIRKIGFGNTVYELYLCNEDDLELFHVFESSIYGLMECEEDVYNWLRGHDIYYKDTAHKRYCQIQSFVFLFLSLLCIPL